jgi:hypothetical protein
MMAVDVLSLIVGAVGGAVSVQTWCESLGRRRSYREVRELRRDNC